ncbi:A24 family peptidase, partial [Singulisphaera rosea]
MDQADVASLFVVASVVIVAAMTDLWKFKVYNALTFPALFTGLAVSAVLGGGAGLGSSLLGAALGFSTLVVFFMMGGVGAGDVKLMTALGAWLGPYLIVQVFLASALAAGLYALVLIVMRGGMFSAAVELLILVRRMVSGEMPTPAEVSIKAEVHRAD